MITVIQTLNLRSRHFRKLAVHTICFTLTISTILFASLPINADEKIEPKPPVLYPRSIVSFPSLPEFSKFVFVVDKTERTLNVFENIDSKLKFKESFPTDIGKNHGPKQKRNDHKTPVGIYFLQKEMTQPEIPFDQYGSLAFSMDYPNIFDQREAKTGNGIWLHAVPDTVPLTRGSRGCVVVRNDIIKQLKSYINLKQTPILITEKIDWLSQEKHDELRKKYLANFEQWRKAWEAQDVDTYIKFYDPTFKNSDMNFRQWYRHKKKLKTLYKFIKVELSEPTILINEDQVVLRFLQKYESDLHKDFGEKTIHARFSDEQGFLIIREDWTELVSSSIN